MSEYADLGPIKGDTLPAYGQIDPSVESSNIPQSTRSARDVINYVVKQFGDEAGVQIEEEDIQTWIDIAQSELAMDEDFNKKLVTRKLTTGQSEYTFPSRKILLTQSMHINGRKITYKSFQQFQEDMEQEEDMTRRGKPETWTEWGGSFKLFPIPDEDYDLSLYVIASPEPIVSPSTVLTIPDRLYSTLLKKVMIHAYKLDENFEAAGFNEQSAENDLQKRREFTNMSAINTYPTITYMSQFDEEGF